jgi:hypothetical protein
VTLAWLLSVPLAQGASPSGTSADAPAVSAAGEVLYFSKSPDPRAPIPTQMLYMSKPAGVIGAGDAFSGSGIQRTALAEPPYGMSAGDQEGDQFQIQLEPPGIQRWQRVESEASFQERMRQETRGRPAPDKLIERIEFPTEPVLATAPFPGRTFPSLPEVVEPNYVCYDRLYFQQKNFERYGWDLGPITPLLSAGTFLWDVVWLPYHAGTDICRKYECSAGYCLPGDAVPLMIYPPEFSVTGVAAEAAAVVSLMYIFP